MKVKINGESHDFADEKMLLKDYLKSKGIEPQMVAVEVNMNVLPKNQYDTTTLQDGDEVEIVKYVGGGC